MEGIPANGNAKLHHHYSILTLKKQYGQAFIFRRLRAAAGLFAVVTNHGKTLYTI